MPTNFEQYENSENKKLQELIDKLPAGAVFITKTGTLRKVKEVLPPTPQAPDIKNTAFVTERIDSGSGTKRDELLSIAKILESYENGHIFHIYAPKDPEGEYTWNETLSKAPQQSLEELPNKIKMLFKEVEGAAFLEDKYTQEEPREYAVQDIKYHPEFEGGGVLLLEGKDSSGKTVRKEMNFRDFWSGFETGQFAVKGPAV